MRRLCVLALLFWKSQSNAFSIDRCMNENRMCDLHGNNLIWSEAGITGHECKQLCQATNDCKVFTYFGPNSFPYHEFCMLFISCDTLDECEDCLTVKSSDCTCGISYEGSIDSDNIVQIEEDVQNEQDCRTLCSLNSNCSVYTYYDTAHVTNVKLCLLLTKLHNPVRSCENCQTGSDICEAFEDCRIGVLDAGDEFSRNKLQTTESKLVSYVSGESGCYKTVHAVAFGSGSNGGECDKFGGGGGSGFINATTFVLQTNKNYKVKIEIFGAETSLTLEETGEVLLSAANGIPRTECIEEGGDGYSGGGGATSNGIAGDGGSDGGNGEDAGYSAGIGSGFNISSINMIHFNLTAGNGGNNQGPHGGGGGGILVDGYGPKSGDIEGVGKGYGGGGKGDPTSVSGSPGCVLLEL